MAHPKGVRATLPKWVNGAVWDQVLMAATDPRFQADVEQFLGSVRLSKELPELLDSACLAPRREKGATGEQCANVWCNLGTSALAIPNPSADAVDFAAGCSELVTRLGGAAVEPELDLRNRFLAGKASLALALIEGDSTPATWLTALARATAYLSVLDERLGILPPERCDAHLAAAYSLTLQLLTSLLPRYGYQAASEIGELVHAALNLADQTDQNRIARAWQQVMTRPNVGSYLRLIGAEVETRLAIDLDSSHHAQRGLVYVDALLPHAETLSPEQGHFATMLRAELLLLQGRYEESMTEADVLPVAASPGLHDWRYAIDARCLLRLGQPRRAREFLSKAKLPSVEQALAAWDANWLGTSAAGHPLTRLGAVNPLEDSQTSWRLMVVAAAASGDIAEALRWSDRSSGFLADSLLTDRAAWISKLQNRLHKEISEFDVVWDGKSDVWNDLTRPLRTSVKSSASPRVGGELAAVDAPLAVREILSRLGSKTALIKILNTEEGLVTLTASLRNGEVNLEQEPGMPSSHLIASRHKEWLQFYRESLCDREVTSSMESEGERVFGTLMDEAERHWGNLMQRHVDSGITDLIFIGDDTIDIPLHAMRIGPSRMRLIERARVSYAPSIHVLRVCLNRPFRPPERRQGLSLRSLIDKGLKSAVGEATDVATILRTERRDLDPSNADFWSELRSADIVHVVAHGVHNRLLPLNSLLGADWVNLSLSDLIAELDLPHCEIVSSLACESAFPSNLRVPGLDFSTVFIAAGARSVLNSTWVVRDDVASAFCRLYFEIWASGCGAAVAFQQTLDRLRRERPTLPTFDWAGIRLVGGT